MIRLKDKIDGFESELHKQGMEIKNIAMSSDGWSWQVVDGEMVIIVKREKTGNNKK